MGSLQVAPQSPPGLHPRGGCTTTGAVAPRGDGKGSDAPKPIPTTNRWRVIAPDDDDEDYDPNNKVKDPADDSLASGQDNKAHIVDSRKLAMHMCVNTRKKTIASRTKRNCRAV